MNKTIEGKHYEKCRPETKGGHIAAPQGMGASMPKDWFEFVYGLVDRCGKALTVDEFAKKYNVNRDTVWDYVKEKRLTLTYLGPRSPRILPEDEREFLSTCRKTA